MLVSERKDEMLVHPWAGKISAFKEHGQPFNTLLALQLTVPIFGVFGLVMRHVVAARSTDEWTPEGQKGTKQNNEIAKEQ